MASDVIFDRVAKRYDIPSRDAAGRGRLARWLRPAPTTGFWAVRDISFEVARGETLGIIGHNGAGKSTLLKLLSRITTPTEGEIRLRGRMAALIEVGSGFHPELTGRENIFLSGSVLGMRRREIASKLDAIIDFSGVSAFIDTPVKWYSSGMYVRLGFAIAAHVDADVLLIDEVLAVGDADYQARCLARIDELKRLGTTLIFISHDLTSVGRIADRALLLQRGRIVASGHPSDVTAEYHRRLAAGAAATSLEGAPTRPDGGIELVGLDFEGQSRAISRAGAPHVTRLRFHADLPLRDLAFDVTYYSPDGQVIVARSSTADSGARLDVPAGPGSIAFSYPALDLPPGAYYVGAVVRNRAAPWALHWWDGGTMLYVEGGAGPVAQRELPHTWHVSTDGPAAAQGQRA